MAWHNASGNSVDNNPPTTAISALPALRRAFERRKDRRYTTCWAGVRPPGEHASHLIEFLDGEFIQIKGADDFFTGLVDKVTTLGGTEDAKVASREAPSRPKHNLPVQLTSFIGREDEIAEINNLVSKPVSARGLRERRPAQATGLARVALNLAGRLSHYAKGRECNRLNRNVVWERIRKPL